MTESLLNPPTDQVVDPNKNYLEDLVGEGKKFKTPEDLAKGKYLADHYVKTLETQLDALREDFMKLREESAAGPSLQELIDQLKTQQQPNDNTPNVNAVNSQQKPSIDPTELKSLVSNAYQEFKVTEREQDNYNLVVGKVKERHGVNYASVLKSQAESLGLSDAEVDSMARKNPKLFFKTFEVDAPRNTETFQTPPQNNTRRDNFAPKTENRGKSFYDRLRRENPTEFYSHRTQVQMDRDLLRLGEAFLSS